MHVILGKSLVDVDNYNPMARKGLPTQFQTRLSVATSFMF
jgi:hypothetical protein